jgi:hypothetical protein
MFLAVQLMAVKNKNKSNVKDFIFGVEKYLNL